MRAARTCDCPRVHESSAVGARLPLHEQGRCCKLTRLLAYLNSHLAAYRVIATELLHLALRSVFWCSAHHYVAVIEA